MHEKRYHSIHPATRRAAIALIPFLIIAWVILYIFPDRTGDWFAWPIQPAMTALFMGAGYLSGAYFFARTASTGDWRRVEAGFLPVALFAGLEALTTILHWPRFTHGHPAFIAWVGLYFITPWLVIGLWLLNRRGRNSEQPEARLRVPVFVRWILGVVGVSMAAAGFYLYANPDVMIAIWPWELTPLTARALLGFLILPAASEISLAFKPDWREYPIILEGQMIALALILLGAARAWADFEPAAAGSAGALFVAAMLFFLLANLAFYLLMQNAGRQRAGGPQEGGAAQIHSGPPNR